MTVYYKQDGVWLATDRPYVMRNNVWTPARNVYVKSGGIWEIAYTFDTTPPDPPEISAQLIDNRYYKLGVRIPGPSDSTLKRIRLLVSRVEKPKSQFGSGYLSNADDTWPDESWSDWYYNNKNPAGDGLSHGVTNDFDYKQYPLNPTDATNLPADKDYFFAAWSEDKHGNWSSGTFLTMHKPKSGAETGKLIVKEANFEANFSGSAELNGANYVEGDLIQRETPRSNGFWFYGSKITSAIGEQGNPTVRNARIRVTRTDDAGQPTANVNVFWHEAADPDDMPVLDADRHAITTIGTINKGESKWLPLPDSFLTKLNSQVKGLGLAYGIQASDYLVAASSGTTPRSGEVNVVWEESL